MKPKLPLPVNTGHCTTLSETSRHRTVKSELADANASNQRTPWARSRPARHSTNRQQRRGDLVDGSHEADLTKGAGSARSGCTSRSGARDLFSLRAGTQYDNSITRCIDVRPRTRPCRPPTGAQKRLKSMLKRAHRAPDEYGPQWTV